MQDLRADPLLPEAILHATSGLPCPAVFGGLPSPPTPPAPTAHPFHAAPPLHPLSPPSLVELPSLRAARQEAARRCLGALLRRRRGGGGWWAVLERAGAGRVETLPLGDFDIGGQEEEGREGGSRQQPRAVLMGLLARRRGAGAARLVDATAALPLYFALPSSRGCDEEEDGGRLVLWRDGGQDGQQQAPEPFVAAEGEGEEEEGEAVVTTAGALASIRSLPWAPSAASGRLPLSAAEAGRMVALSWRGKGSVRLFADLLSWRRQSQQPVPTSSNPSGEEDCVDVTFEAEDGAAVVVKARPFLLVDPAAVLPLHPDSTTAAAPPSPTPPSPPPLSIDWRAARLAPALSVDARRARTDEYWDAPPLRLLVLVKRVDQQQYGGGNGGGGGRVVLLCRDANDAAPAVARLFLYASHRAGASSPIHHHAVRFALMQGGEARLVD